MSRISILGTGNGGITCAYFLAARGHEICLYDFDDFDVQIKAVNTQGGIGAVSVEHGETMLMPGFAQNIYATHDVEEMMRFSDVYYIVCPSFAQERFFAQMMPYLHSGAVIITFAANYASLVYTKMMEQSGQTDLDVTFCDTNTLPWACRLSARPGYTCISGIKRFIPTSIYPRENNADGHIMRILEDVSPLPVRLLHNPLEAGLENINIGGHPLYCAVNMGLLENLQGNVNYYRDCCSPSTAKAQAKLENERLLVGRAFGLNLKTDIEMVNALYGTNEKTSYDFNKNSSAHAKLSGAPASAKHRYITEDIPYSLVPLYELAQTAAIEVPMTEACITLGSAYNEEDYHLSGRTLKRMGLAGLSKEEIIAKVSK